MTTRNKPPGTEQESTEPAATIARAQADFLRLLAGLVADQWIQDHSAPAAAPAADSNGDTETVSPKQ